MMAGEGNGDAFVGCAGLVVGGALAHTLQLASAPATALSLSSDKRDPSLLPTTRYLGLVIEGAIEHGLPAPWVGSLRAVPAREETEEERAFR